MANAPDRQTAEFANASIALELCTECTSTAESSDFKVPIDTVRRCPWVVLFASFCLLAAGTATSLVASYSLNETAPPCDSCDPEKFSSVFVMLLIQFIAEFLCLPIHYAGIFFRNRCAKTALMPDSSEPAKKRSPFYWWILIGTIEATGCTAQIYAYMFASISLTQLIMNFTMLVAAFLSLAIFRIALRIHNYIGVAACCVGVTVSGVSAILSDDSGTSLAWLGVMLAIFTAFMLALQLTLEQRVLTTFLCHPLEGAGYEGIVGLVISGFVLLTTELVGYEKPSRVFYQFSQNTGLLMAQLSNIIILLVFKAASLVISQKASGLLVSLLYVTRSVIVWIVEVSIGWVLFSGVTVVGILFILFGIVCFNTANWPCCMKEWNNFMSKPLVCCGLANPDDEE